MINISISKSKVTRKKVNDVCRWIKIEKRLLYAMRHKQTVEDYY